MYDFAFCLRLWNNDIVGRWSDEQALLEHGYASIELLKNHDFSNPFWYEVAIDHPPLAFYFYGLVSYKDFLFFDPKESPSYNAKAQGAPIFDYDLTYTRLLSVFISSLAVLFVFFFGARYFSLFVGIIAAIILSMMPHFLGISQFVVLETWIILFFTACVFVYCLYLEKNKRVFLMLTGILTGMSLLIKESNILLFAFYLGTFFVWKKITHNKTITFAHLIIIFLIALITSFVLWPMPWLHLPSYIHALQSLWFNGGLLPALIFGKHMQAHSFYYILAVFITTPIIIILLTAFGMIVAMKKKKHWIYIVLIVWFLVPFLMTFFHHRQHMIRYIIAFYAPLALLVGIGFEYLLKNFTKSNVMKLSITILLILYLTSALLSVAPYYLEYYNELVGGTKNVYEKKLFYIGWFGEGLKRPGEYLIKHAHENARIGLALDPNPIAIYKSPKLHYEIFNSKHIYDYVVVNYYESIRMRFDEKILQKNYMIVYREKVNGVDLVRVYKHK